MQYLVTRMHKHRWHIKWRPALAAQLYWGSRVVLGNKSNTVAAVSIYILWERRLSGPFPSARCPVYCFRKAHLLLSSPCALASRARMNRKKRKGKKKTDGWMNFSMGAVTGLRFVVQTIIVAIFVAMSSEGVRQFLMRKIFFCHLWRFQWTELRE